MARTGGRYARCIGSEVPEDRFRYGHNIMPGTEHHMFPTVASGSGHRGANNYLRQRCELCQSTHYNYFERLTKKATAWRRYHAGRMVDKGFAPSAEMALQQMEQHGVTVEFLTALFQNAIGNPCPGLCLEDPTSSDPLAPHLITLADLEGDWRDPRYCITPENVGPLCKNCNRQKHEKPWPDFIARQRAIRTNIEWDEAISDPAPYTKPLTLFDWEQEGL